MGGIGEFQPAIPFAIATAHLNRDGYPPGRETVHLRPSDASSEQAAKRSHPLRQRFTPGVGAAISLTNIS